METVNSRSFDTEGPLKEPPGIPVLDVQPLCSLSTEVDPPDSPECPPLEDFDLARRKEEQHILFKAKKPKPSAVRDFPVGCGRNAPAMTREDLPLKQPPEVQKIPVKRDANAKPGGREVELTTSKSEGKQTVAKTNDTSKSEGKQTVAKTNDTSKSEGKQTVAKTNDTKRGNSEGDVAQSNSEVRRATPKTKIAKKVGDAEDATASKLDARETVLDTNLANKGDGEGDVPPESEANQAATKTKVVKKGDEEGDGRPVNLETTESIQKKKLVRKVDDGLDAMPSKFVAKQTVAKMDIVSNGDGEGDDTLSKSEAKEVPVKPKNDRKEDGDDTPSNLEAKQATQKKKLVRKVDDASDVMPSKLEAKRTAAKKNIESNGDSEGGDTPSKSEAKEVPVKLKNDRKEDGDGDATPSNLEVERAVQKKKSVKKGRSQGEATPVNLESKLSVPKKKIDKKGDGDADVTPSKLKSKQAVSKTKSSKQDSGMKTPVLDSEELDPMDSQTTPVKMKISVEDPEVSESELTPLADDMDVGTESSSKKRKKTPASRPRRSNKKTKVFRSGEGVEDVSAGSDRKAVKRVLMIFDALRRKFMQEDEVNKQAGTGGGGAKRPDLKAGTLMMDKGLWLNRDRRIIGSVPGVQPGDHFYFRMELCVLGLHAQVQAGIDYITAKNNQWNEPVAVSIIASGGYEDNEDDGGETLVYTGQGGNNYKMDKKQNDDQKLERGNLALERSKHHGVEVRVIRGIKDNASPSGKIYTYDGLYKVEESWLDKGKSGFGVFKYRLQRIPGQPELASQILKSAVKWKTQPSLRGLLLPDISSKRESIPVCLVNTVDDDKGLPHFEYISKVRYSNSVVNLESSSGCDCKGSCVAGDKCLCFSINGGEMPYNQNGILVRGKPLIYECGELCRCPPTCRNRVSQKGPKFHLEVFKTDNRGWGVRSWDSIPAGSFICEYAGEVDSDKQEVEQDEENDYLLHAKRMQEKWIEWGDVSDILPEKKQDVSSEGPPQLNFVIDSRNMGNVSRFINHSCSPNCFLQFVLYDHCDSRFPHIMLFAMEQIPPLTELTFDYGLTEIQSGENEEIGDSKGSMQSKVCLCGSLDCRQKFC
eukprot:Gb_40999 [translate_table: standard]